MKNKNLTIIFGMLLIIVLAGSVLAERSIIVNSSGISIPMEVVAGDPFEASFGFDYYYDGNNEGDSPLIIELNVTSEDDEFYPVWKGDFKISGSVKKTWIWGAFIKNVYFNCSEEYEQTIEHPLDAQNVTAPNGTFYCYNEEGDLALNEHDEVTLNIVSHQALYPGKYNLTASMFYLTDKRAPFVNITNKNLFDLYYREIDNVEILASISDGSDIVDKWGEAFLGYENWTVPFIEMASGDYRFSRNTPVDIVEGNYSLFVFAKDEYNNTGNDSVTLKIDRTAPNITLIQPNGSIYEDVLPIVAEIVDVKAGLNVTNVWYRLREMDGNNTCPEDGVGTWICYNSGWLSLPNTSGDLFGVNINTTEVGLNGEYWLEIRAYDILGNEGILE